MTVCIAAICDKGRTAILIADRRVGIGYVEGDLAFKMGWLSPTWRYLLAGNDFSAADEVAARAIMYLQDNREVSIGDVQEALASAYQDVRLSRIETKVMKSRGWTLDQFKEKGRQLLPPAVYAEIDTELKVFDLNADLIACGFDGSLVGIVRVGNPGQASIETRSHFETIGIGEMLADASLYRRGYNDEMPLRIALYYAYEAKVEAEHASGVGEPSYVIILKREKHIVHEIVVPSQQLDYIREICEELKPRGPSAANLQTMDIVLRHGLSTRKPIPKRIPKSMPHHPRPARRRPREG